MNGSTDVSEPLPSTEGQTHSLMLPQFHYSATEGSSTWLKGRYEMHKWQGDVGHGLLDTEPSQPRFADPASLDLLPR